MTQVDHSRLKGRRILVVEDEYMIAEEVAEMLSQVGAEPVGPVPRVSDALRLIDRDGRIDAALLDVNLSNEPIWPVVDVLLTRTVPLVLTTGYDATAIPLSYGHLPRCEKPTTGQEIARALEQAIAVKRSID